MLTPERSTVRPECGLVDFHNTKLCSLKNLHHIILCFYIRIKILRYDKGNYVVILHIKVVVYFSLIDSAKQRCF